MNQWGFMMKTYNTYQEAKINNPDSEIVTTAPNWDANAEFVGKFEALARDGRGAHYLDDDTAWVICNPADYCMSVKDFILAGNKFKAGDLVLESTVKTMISDHVASEWNNSYHYIGDCAYVLRAKALDELNPSSKVEFDNVPQQVESLVGEVEWDGLNGFSFLCKNGNIIELNIPPEFKDGIIKISNGKIEVLR